jgi:hypothetical protein
MLDIMNGNQGFVGSRTWHKLFGENSVLDFIGQLDHPIDFLLTLLPFGNELLEVFIDSVLSSEESVDLVLFQREASLDGLFTSPIFTMGLSLDENLRQGISIREQRRKTAEITCRFVRNISVPPQTDGFCTLSLFQATEVQIQVLVIEVDRSDSCQVA